MLSPEKNNITIVEDPRTGEVSLLGAEVIKVLDLDHFLQLLQVGEANRHATNTKLNTESSRSHAILMVYVQRSVKGKEENEGFAPQNNTRVDLSSGTGAPKILKSKFLIVDLAGSERIDKSGSEGHMLEEAKFINLSLTSLGKCINALAENSPHIPIRDSKLTSLLRDSFGGSARTSLIITIGPSTRHYTETASTIMFGQRAMKIVNMVKLKEEFDYESLCRKLEYQVDSLTAEMERQQKWRDVEKLQIDRKLEECQNSLAEAKNIVVRSEVLEKENDRLESEIKFVLEQLEIQKDQNKIMCDDVDRLTLSLKQSEERHLENYTHQKVLSETTQMYEKKIAELFKQLEDEHAKYESSEEQLLQESQLQISTLQMVLADTTQMYEKKMTDLSTQLEEERVRSEHLEEQLVEMRKHLTDSIKEENDCFQMKLQEMDQLQKNLMNELKSLRSERDEILSEKTLQYQELQKMLQRLVDEERQRKCLEMETANLKKLLSEYKIDLETKQSCTTNGSGGAASALGNQTRIIKGNKSRDALSGQRSTIFKIFEEVGLQKILDLLRSEDLDVQIHAVKVVANLAAEDINQERIVEEGGLDALLLLLESSENTTILRVISGAIANLAMNEFNQGLIMSKGGARLLANLASKTDDPQTLRMVAGAIANLCGNEKLHVMLKEEGGIKALLYMVKSGNSDVIAQIARGLANFAKCESRTINQGYRKGRSLLVEDGALTWMVANQNITISSTRRHIELALCHLAQNEDNVQDFVTSGGIIELKRISLESPREDIRHLAKKTLNSNPALVREMQKG
ncbi:Armadillo repeat-containing kinesin-like protein 1 [Acorus calamus]|uniref:Kinesin-like protein n=1 Tax=Acorus calamus TaxID=4465 RepID=A0AAV9CM98_ACOCL|nr:Armadillo repeat-containing kinesin-like protein 1 [Acorus calamus]